MRRAAGQVVGRRSSRDGSRAPMSGADNVLARATARIPAPIHRKLVVAFAAIVVLLVVLGAFGLRALGQSNGRMEALGELQQRLAAYRTLQTNNAELRRVRDNLSAEVSAYSGASDPFSAPIDQTSKLRIEDIEAILRQLQTTYDPNSLGFAPPADEAHLVGEINDFYQRFTGVMARVLELRRQAKTADALRLQALEAEPAAYELEVRIDQLVTKAQTKITELLNQNRFAYQNSRAAFTSIVLSAVALALILGFAISWSIIGPIQKMKSRLAQIAAGDFSGRVDIVNRDELGVLATDLNRMNDELGRLCNDLETASRHKSEFLASMSHELRTPLNAIIGFSEVLLEQMFGELNERQAGYLNDILSSGRHLLSLINDILDLSKIEAGKMELEPSTFALPAVLEAGVTMVRERATNHGIALSLDVAADVDAVEADERKLKQVVFNLLSNAVKFTPDGGRVDVIARRNGSSVEVAVRDTGIGIDPADQERIFEEFQQAGQREGSGLGLALARSFVTLHGGRLWVESEPGAGSTFTFSVPIRQTVGEPEEARTAVVPMRSADLEPTVLVIEDDQRSADLLRIYLEGAGFSVATAPDGEVGLETARCLHPDAIVLDLLLPGLTGWDILAAVKADPELTDIPVVIASMIDERGKGYALGATDYLVKPVDRQELIAALAPLVAGATDGEPVKVLAIDDDPIVLELISSVLSVHGYRVLRAAGGEEGLRAARAELPALVICDLLMPGVDGFDVVEQLRADPATAEIPIVVLTAKTIDQSDKQRLNSHVAHLAEKGRFSRAEFVELVRRCCRAPVG